MQKSRPGILLSSVMLYAGALVAYVRLWPWPSTSSIWVGVLCLIGLVVTTMLKPGVVQKTLWLLLLLQFGGWFFVWVNSVATWDQIEGIWQAQVVTVERAGHQNRVILKESHVGLIACETTNDIDWQEGQGLLVAGKLSRPERAANIGGFDARRYWKTRGVTWLLQLEDWQRVDGIAVKPHTGWLTRQLLAVENGGVALGLVLGDRSAIEPAITERWRRLGVSHLLAVSGMHLAIISALLALILARAPISPIWRCFVLILMMFGYVVLLDFRPSALRAWIMLTSASSAVYFGRSLSLLHHWVLAVFLFFLVDPTSWQLLSVQMSFAATGAILLYVPSVRKLKYRLLQSLLISGTAQLGLFPILANYFGEWAVLGAIFTVLLTPIVIAVMISTLPWLLFGWIFPLAEEPLRWSVGFLLWITEVLAPYSPVIAIPRFTPGTIFLWYAVVIGIGMHLRYPFFFSQRRRWFRIVVTALVFMVLVGLPAHWRSPLVVYVIDVGQGDAMFIHTPAGQAILIDGGGVSWPTTDEFNIGRARILPLLQHLGIEHIDLVVMTHPHEDHLQGLLPVLEEYSVGMIWDNGEVHTTRSYLHYLQAIEERNIPHYQVRAGTKVTFSGRVDLTVLHPTALLSGTGSDLNNNSVVLLLEYQNRRMLFSGDLDLYGQMAMMAQSLPTVDWLKIPHHGSANAWFEPWYSKLQPRQGVISVGRSNRFNHPASVVLAGLAEQGVEVFRTDLQGMVKTYVMWGRLFTRNMR